ncbi:MAG: hypothetical protein Q8R36_03575 [bacterium]|nr:hypothetical protein [bacterium]
MESKPEQQEFWKGSEEERLLLEKVEANLDALRRELDSVNNEFQEKYPTGEMPIGEMPIGEDDRVKYRVEEIFGDEEGKLGSYAWFTSLSKNIELIESEISDDVWDDKLERAKRKASVLISFLNRMGVPSHPSG